MSEQYTKFSKTKNHQDGFSLIETMVAMVVIGVGLVSLVAISAYVARTNSVSNRLAILSTAAQDQVDRLRTARWSKNTEDPMVTVGGSSDIVYEEEPGGGMTPSSPTQPLSAGSPQTTGSYQWTLDSEDPHRASVTRTPIGDLCVVWEVTQGPTPELRYVTVRVFETTTPADLAEGYEVSTMIVRN